MTTHLEEVLEKLEQKYCAFEFCCDDADTVSKPQLELLKRAFIKSHIAYLEKEAGELKEELEIQEKLHKKIGEAVVIGRARVAGIVAEKYSNLGKIMLLKDQISHKQQEILQAKKLLK